MKAIEIYRSCNADDLEVTEIAKPKIKENHVVVKVQAFGLNHSEVLFRKYEVANDIFKKPVVPGIECVGTIEESLTDDFKKGDTVIALMGGMGRSFNGSYEEYALLPIKNVFKIDTKLDWIKLASIPETFYTAYGSLFICLDLKKEDTLLVRGGTSALGIASIQMAKALGCCVIATTTDDDKSEFLDYLGVDSIIVDHNDFKDQMDEKVDKILELVGPRTALESMKYLKYHGICCSTGILGGQVSFQNFDPIKNIPNGRYLTGFYSNNPTREEIDDMFKFLNDYNINPYIGKVYTLEEVKLFQSDLEYGKTNGKGVVAVSEEAKKLVKKYRK